MHLKSLTYTSWARSTISDTDVDAILRSARTNNPLDGLTGVLIFNGSAFMQVLEGAEAAVDEMTRRLSTDPRHFNMHVREQRLISERAFPDWSMAYLRLEEQEFVGEAAVERALRRNLPDSTRNIIKGVTLSLHEEMKAQVQARAQA